MNERDRWYLPLSGLSLVLAFASPVFGQSVYRCTDAAGKVTYSEFACSGSPSTKLDVSVPRADPDAIAASRSRWQAERAALERREQVRQAEEAAAAQVRRAALDNQAEASRAAARKAKTDECDAAIREMNDAGRRMNIGESIDTKNAAYIKCGVAPPPPAAPSASAAGPSGMRAVTDQYGRTYSGPEGGGTVISQTGKPCLLTGSVIRCN